MRQTGRRGQPLAHRLGSYRVLYTIDDEKVTIALTMDRYTHTLVGEQSEALNALPDLSQPAQQTLRATGTDDARPDEKGLGVLLGAFESIPMPRGGASRLPPSRTLESPSLVPAMISAAKQGPGSVCTSG